MFVQWIFHYILEADVGLVLCWDIIVCLHSLVYRK